MSPLFYMSTPLADDGISVVDDSGVTIIMEKPAKRIISLAPSITELLFAAGAGDRLVAVVPHSDFPDAARSITRVNGYPSLDIEKIVSLRPDLVIAWRSGTTQAQADKLRKLGITVYFSEPLSVSDVAKSLKRFGILAGTARVATQAAERFKNKYKKLRGKFSGIKVVRVFYEVWNKPLITVNGKHIISEVIELCGGKNVFADTKSLTPRISLESVMSADVDVIISGAEGMTYTDWAKGWTKWSQIPAVKNNQLYQVNPDLIQRAGPRILEGAAKICTILSKVR